MGQDAAAVGLPILPAAVAMPKTLPATETPSLSPYQFAKNVEKVVEEYIRPLLQKDGGDLEIIDVKDNLVYCRLAGACGACACAEQTLKMMVEKTLKDIVDERIRVIAV